MIHKVLILLFCLITISQQTLKCLHTTNTEQLFARGDDIAICVHFTPYNQRIAFNIKVDKYSALLTKGAFELYSPDNLNPAIVLQADNQQSSTFPVSYMRDNISTNNFKVIPVFNAVVQLDEGKVVKVHWDNKCFDCPSDDCFSETQTDGSNSYQVQNCKRSKCDSGSDSLNCDPKIYVTFIGTDKNGNHLTSAGLRMSRFQQYSVGEMYQSAKSTAEEKYQAVTNLWNGEKSGLTPNSRRRFLEQEDQFIEYYSN